MCRGPLFPVGHQGDLGESGWNNVAPSMGVFWALTTTSATFGRIRNTVTNTARQIMLGVMYSF